MSKARQRQEAERAQRLRKQAERAGRRLKELAGQKIGVPVAGAGVILDRTTYLSDYQAPPSLAGVAFDQARKQWLDGSDRFLFYVSRIDGRRIIWEFGQPEHLRIYLNRTLLEFAERHAAVAMNPEVSEPLKSELAELCGAHVLSVSEHASPTEDPTRGLGIGRFSDPVHGRFTDLTISKDLVESGTVFGVLRFLDSLVDSRDAIEENWLSLHVAFEGYDSDPREVFQIPRIRQFIGKVTSAAPWWLGLIAPSEHLVWLAALAEIDDVTHHPDGTFNIQFAPSGLEEVIAQFAKEIGPLLRCAAFETDDTPTQLMQDVSMSLAKLMSGTNPVFEDPLIRKATQQRER